MQVGRFFFTYRPNDDYGSDWAPFCISLRGPVCLFLVSATMFGRCVEVGVDY